MELLKVDTVEQAREKLYDAAEIEFKTEAIELTNGLGRILACDINAEESVPEFRKSTVDGYAVIAQNTQGVTDSIPVFLEVIEEVQIGSPAEKEIKPGQCSYVPTGGMIPEGADAMVMIEYTEHFDENQIAVYEAVSSGRNVIQIGEDVTKGEIVLKAGTEIGPQEIGTLAALGISNIQVFIKPKITIISTGDELIDINDKLTYGKIRDINSYGLQGLSEENNIEVIKKHILKDDENLIKTAIEKAMEESDIVAVSGGSSQGKKDFTAKVMDELSDPGVFTHGIALKPGQPTILAFDKTSETILIGLPGHPTAAMIVFDFFCVWLVNAKMKKKEKKKIRAVMETNVAGGSGRATCLMVELAQGEPYIAKPVLGKSGLITTLIKADGYTIIETNKEGLKKGETVSVTLF